MGPKKKKDDLDDPRACSDPFKVHKKIIKEGLKSLTEEQFLKCRELNLIIPKQLCPYCRKKLSKASCDSELSSASQTTQFRDFSETEGGDGEPPKKKKKNKESLQVEINQNNHLRKIILKNVTNEADEETSGGTTPAPSPQLTPKLQGEKHSQRFGHRTDPQLQAGFEPDTQRIRMEQNVAIDSQPQSYLLQEKQRNRRKQDEANIIDTYVTPDTIKRYELSNPPHGESVIIYMEERKSDYGKADSILVRNLWQKIGCTITVIANPNKQELDSKLKLLRENINAHPNNYDYLSITFIGHGSREEGKEFLQLNNNTIYYVEDLYDIFTADECPGLAKKPKLFYLQACRGRRDSIRYAGDDAKPLHPPHRDFYVLQPSWMGHKSYYNRITGRSPFIETLCEVYETNFQHTDIQRMTLMINQKIATLEIFGSIHQTTTELSTLSKYFHLSNFKGGIHQQFALLPETQRNRMEQNVATDPQPQFNLLPETQRNRMEQNVENSIDTNVSPDAIERYELSNPPRGEAVIIYMEEPTISPYGKADSILLMNLWPKIGCTPTEIANPNKTQLVEKLRLLRDKINDDPSRYDYLSIAFIGHGRLEEGREYLKLKDDDKYFVEDLYELFAANNCPGLAKKPKLFYLQACRGERRYVRHADCESAVNPLHPLPPHADMYVLQPSWLGHRNYYDGVTGRSFFIETLCKVYETNFQHWDIQSLHLLVNAALKKSAKKQTYQVTAELNTLSKKFHFSNFKEGIHPEGVATDSQSQSSLLPETQIIEMDWE